MRENETASLIRRMFFLSAVLIALRGRDAPMGAFSTPHTAKSEIFLYGVIEIKPLRGFFGIMRTVIYFYAAVLSRRPYIVFGLTCRF